MKNTDQNLAHTFITVAVYDVTTNRTIGDFQGRIPFIIRMHIKEACGLDIPFEMFPDLEGLWPGSMIERTFYSPAGKPLFKAIFAKKSYRP